MRKRNLQRNEDRKRKLLRKVFERILRNELLKETVFCNHYLRGRNMNCALSLSPRYDIDVKKTGISVANGCCMRARPYSSAARMAVELAWQFASRRKNTNLQQNFHRIRAILSNKNVIICCKGSLSNFFISTVPVTTFRFSKYM